MSDDAFPELVCRYSRRARLSFGTVFLILGYGGVGMVTGLIDIDPAQRPLQIVIGLVFLALAAGFGYATARLFMAGSRPVVTLDRTGLWDRRVTTAPIPFPAIARIEGIQPSFIENLVLPGGRKGTLIVHVRPGDLARIGFAGTLLERLFIRPFAGKGRLRIFYRTLDIPYHVLLVALGRALEIANGTKEPSGS